MPLRQALARHGRRVVWGWTLVFVLALLLPVSGAWAFQPGIVTLEASFDEANLVVFGRVEAGEMLPLDCRQGVRYAVRVQTAFKGRLARDQLVWFTTNGDLSLGEEYFLFLARPSRKPLPETSWDNRWAFRSPPLDVEQERACARQRPPYQLDRGLWVPMSTPRVVAGGGDPYFDMSFKIKRFGPVVTSCWHVHTRSGDWRRLSDEEHPATWFDFGDFARVMNGLAVANASGHRPPVPRFAQEKSFYSTAKGPVSTAQLRWQEFRLRPVWPWVPGLLVLCLSLWTGHKPASRPAWAVRLRPWRGWLAVAGLVLCALAGIDTLARAYV